MKPLFIILIILAVLVLSVIVVGFIIGEYFYAFAVSRHYKKSRVSAITNEKNPDKPPVTYPYDVRVEWFDEMSSEKVSITSFDGLKLCALLVENPSSGNAKFAILCHGYTGHANESGFFGEKLYPLGFGILAPAARGHDISEGDYIGMGWHERIDIQDWIKYLNRRYNNPQIILYGVSMGAATVMMTAGEDLPANVKCAIEDCGYSSIYEEYVHCLQNMLKLPAAPIMFFARPMFLRKLKINLLKDGYSTKQLAEAKIPMLFAHGTEDRFVPFWMLDANYDAHPGPKEKVVIQGASHAAGPWLGGEEYWDKILGFIKKYTE
ncbi:MAG: alpha/beta hydrolase [Lachnospiraceae bacterium]|jgi:fermentation-respiration switch protein FrsA (DUF1100 family)